MFRRCFEREGELEHVLILRTEFLQIEMSQQIHLP
jgi:hypothetical protein